MLVQLHDEAVGKVVDRFMIERFMTAARVSMKKLRLYAEHAENREVQRHLTLMAEANDNAIKQLDGLLSQLS